METTTIPPSAFPPSPILSPPIDFGKAKKVPIKPQKKQPKTVDKTLSKADGVAKPKQSKSRNGCITCKAKRLKCDEIKPSCQQCQKRNVNCGGYKKEFKWRAFEDSTFTTKPIPSPNPPNATIPSWPMTDNPMASTATSLTATASHPQQTAFGPDGTDVLDNEIVSGLATPPATCACCPLSSIPPDNRGSLPTFSTLSHTAKDGPIPYGDYNLGHQSLHYDFDPYIETDIENSFIDDGSTLQTITASSSTSSQQIERFPPVANFGSAIMDPFHTEQSVGNPTTFDTGTQLQLETSQQDDQVEEIIRPPEITNDRLIGWPSPSSSQSSPSSENSISKGDIYSFPKMSSRSPEMLLMRFDQQTCGILSVKDGPTENPWRTTIWPLAQDSPALYHAIVSMTAFHTSKNRQKMRYEGLVHMRKSVKYLGSGIRNGSIRVDAALATTLALAFSESWDRHISTGIAHLRGAKAMVSHALADAGNNTLTPHEMKRLRFLCSTWVYMDVIARLTSVDDDDSTDFEYALHASVGPLENQQEVDPLMGCASTLFPLIGRVANLVRRVRKTHKNSIHIISQANDLKTAVETWDAADCFEAPEDQTSDIQHSLDTAEAYRWATLLYLHQAVPEIPSIPSEELARKVIVYLLKVPLSSRVIIIQIYPLLAAGCELASNEDRAWVEDRWAAMMRRMLIGNIDRCWEVVKEVWDRRDADESEKARLALRTVRSPRSKGRSAHGHSIRERPPRGFIVDEAGLSNDRSSGTRPQHVQETQMARNMPPSGLKRRSSESIEDLDYERTVRGRLHWVGVMKDWNWEVLLG
ncbi:MAG: hypothetical protein L6R38_002600 [Xanthoria sp. 2 TBL-2021]|nr:MAG: hypothetical protein L6R38_002600 [Xanthoria sp. 2 TBL-2021]